MGDLNVITKKLQPLPGRLELLTSFLHKRYNCLQASWRKPNVLKPQTKLDMFLDSSAAVTMTLLVGCLAVHHMLSDQKTGSILSRTVTFDHVTAARNPRTRSEHGPRHEATQALGASSWQRPRYKWRYPGDKSAECPADFDKFCWLIYC